MDDVDERFAALTAPLAADRSFRWRLRRLRLANLARAVVGTAGLGLCALGSHMGQAAVVEGAPDCVLPPPPA